MKNVYKGFWILLLCLVAVFLFLGKCKQSPTDMVSIKKSTWDSILKIKETPPKITIDTVYLKGDVVYVERKLPVPVKSQKDTTITVYTDSLVNKEISVWVKDTVKGVLVSREWQYSPIVQKVVKETTIFQPKIVMVDVPINIPKNGFYFYALTGGNSNAFIYGGGIDWITKKDRQIGYSYQRFGNVGFHSVRIGMKIKRPGN
jgi:hypothetical protein